MSKIDIINDKNIPSLLSKEGLTVVLMTSPWDGNGIIMRSIMESISGNFSSVNFSQADYESSPQLARLFSLLSPPGILLIKEGELLHRITKPVSAGKISELINASVA
ncbi:thioredoxin family protein [Neolewinella agarilytica]|uniref:thioredoxin family protein n=1 Tax=Neolewinella agarilytica TaxID=478744 RepID=UPI002356FC61|nr:thioredoxin family protein [Neolewinella agarilytica]